MTPSVTQLCLLASSWLIYFIIHSLTASLAMKRWIAGTRPDWMPAYRLCFNLLAASLLLIPLYLVYSYQGTPLWQWQGYEKLMANSLAYAAIAGFIWSLKYYDGAEFIGLRQWKSREKSVEDQEHFYISPFHRFVRHPWYFFGLIYIWVQDMDPAWLVSAILITLYLVVGSRLEERKLITYHGTVYTQYIKAVPGLIPLPWRFLSKKNAQTLTREQPGSNS